MSVGEGRGALGALESVSRGSKDFGECQWERGQSGPSVNGGGGQ